MNKIISYLGFAKKSNNLVTGQTALKKSKKQFHLILVDNTASENLQNLAKNLANKHICEFIISKIKLTELIKQEDIKILGIIDENLSIAIINNRDVLEKSN